MPKLIKIKKGLNLRMIGEATGLDREHITLFANFRKQMVYPLTELLDLLLGRKLMLYMQNCKMDIR